MYVCMYVSHCSTKPNLELEAFFKRHFADVNFIQGTVMDIHSCQMMKVCPIFTICKKHHASPLSLRWRKTDKVLGDQGAAILVMV